MSGLSNSVTPSNFRIYVPNLRAEIGKLPCHRRVGETPLLDHCARTEQNRDTEVPANPGDGTGPDALEVTLTSLRSQGRADMSACGGATIATCVAITAFSNAISKDWCSPGTRVEGPPQPREGVDGDRFREFVADVEAPAANHAFPEYEVEPPFAQVAQVVHRDSIDMTPADAFSLAPRCAEQASRAFRRPRLGNHHLTNLALDVRQRRFRIDGRPDRLEECVGHHAVGYMRIVSPHRLHILAQITIENPSDRTCAAMTSSPLAR